MHLDTFLQKHGGAVEGEPEPDAHDSSIFSRIARSDEDEANLVLWRGKTVFVLMNLYPYNNGHVLIVPFREVERYGDLDPNERLEIAETIAKVTKWIDGALQPEGYNIGMNEGTASGAGVPEHLHVHVVPRWSGDTNFMPTTGDVKVIPQSIEDSYRRIRAQIDVPD
jgi:ATP adenylyltransferase